MIDPQNMQNWPTISFSLHDASGRLLVALPPTVGIQGEIGLSDPYTWERPPGSSAWFPLGDGLPKEPPRLVLGGNWEYRNVTEAKTHAAQIRQALSAAAEVRWLGGWLANLRRDVPGTYTYTTGEEYRQITHKLTLNLTAPLGL